MELFCVMIRLMSFCVGLLVSALVITSCSDSSDATIVEPDYTVSTVLKTEKMLNFENALKEWRGSNASDAELLGDTARQSKLEIENHAKILLLELGANQSEIDTKNAISTDMLVYFALEEYSKKLSEMYNNGKR